MYIRGCVSTTRVRVPEFSVVVQYHSFLESSCHKEAMRVESTHDLVEKQGGISACFDTIVSIQKKAFIGYLKCVRVCVRALSC